LYHPFLLVQRGLHLRLLSLPTRGLVLHGRLIMYRSADHFQCSYPNPISTAAAVETDGLGSRN